MTVDNLDMIKLLFWSKSWAATFMKFFVWKPLLVWNNNNNNKHIFTMGMKFIGLLKS